MRFELVMLVEKQLDKSVVEDEIDLVARYSSCFDDTTADIVKEHIITKNNIIRTRSIHRLTRVKDD